MMSSLQDISKVLLQSLKAISLPHDIVSKPLIMSNVTWSHRLLPWKHYSWL